MAGHRSALQSFEEGTQLRALRGQLDNPRFVLDGVGALLVSTSQQAFRDERLGSVKWKTRDQTGMVPNWPGILSDLSAGRAKPPQRRFEKGKVLSDGGALRRSVSWRVVSGDTVEAGSNLPYAAVLHSGGESKTVTITRTMQDRLSDLIDGAEGRAKKAAAREWTVGTTDKQMKAAVRAHQAGTLYGRLRWLLDPALQGQRLTVKHPPRPIVGVPAELVEKVEEFFGVTIRKGA